MPRPRGSRRRSWPGTWTCAGPAPTGSRRGKPFSKTWSSSASSSGRCRASSSARVPARSWASAQSPARSGPGTSCANGPCGLIKVSRWWPKPPGIRRSPSLPTPGETPGISPAPGSPCSASPPMRCRPAPSRCRRGSGSGRPCPAANFPAPSATGSTPSCRWWPTSTSSSPARTRTRFCMSSRRSRCGRRKFIAPDPRPGGSRFPFS